jgi:hypothetical protein
MQTKSCGSLLLHIKGAAVLVGGVGRDSVLVWLFLPDEGGMNCLRNVTNVPKYTASHPNVNSVCRDNPLIFKLFYEIKYSNTRISLAVIMRPIYVFKLWAL